MKKLKEAWKGLTKLEKTMVGIRDTACLCLIITGLLTVLGLVPHGAPIAWLLPLVAISQAVISWKRNRATAIFFLGFVLFFAFVFLVSKG